MSRRLPTAAAVLIGTLMVIGALAGPAPAASSAPSADATFLSLLNGLRSTLGLGTLSLDSQMSGVARAWSDQMAARGALSHNGALSNQLQGVDKYGENVAFGGVAQSIFSGLAASTVHLRNMTDPQFNRIGIGTVVDAQGRLWTTQVFARAAGSAPSASTGAPAAGAGTPSTPSRSGTPSTAGPAPTPTPAPATSAPATAPPAAAITTAPAWSQPSAGSTPPDGATTKSSADELAAPSQTVSSRSDGGAPTGLLAAAALFGLLLLGGVGFFLRRVMTSP